MTLPLPAPQDYTDKDFAAIRLRIQNLITAAFPDWSDFERSRFENVFIDAFAHMMDVVTFYQDMQARETRWGTVRLRRDMIELAKIIGYDLDTQEAAVTDVVFSIPSVTAGDVTIPIGTTVKTLGVGSSVVRFQTTAGGVITAGLTDSAAVAVEHSEQQSDSFTARGVTDEEFKLAVRPFLDLSETVTIAGAPWTRVTVFLDSTGTDKHYTIKVDENDFAHIKLGDSIYGEHAAPSDAVVVDYKTGGGEEGNVDSASLQKVEGGPWYDALGNQVSLSCTNAVAATGGNDRETVDEARTRAPRSLRVLNRCVARTDFEDLAIQVSGVARALALSSNEDATVAEGQVKVWVVPSGGGVAAGALLTSIESYINTNYPVPVNCSWEALSATYVDVNVVAWVYLEEGAVEATVITAVRTALTEFLQEEDASGDPNENVTFGFYYKDVNGDFEGELAYSDVEDVIKGVSGIRRLGTTADGRGMTLGGVEDDVSLLIREFPQKGTLTLRNGDTAAVMYNGPI